MIKTSETLVTNKNSDSSQKDHPLTNIMVNVLIPVIALGVLSKEEGKLWQIGPLWGMVVAVAFPLVYGTYDLFLKRKMNFFSVLGVFSILLTGGITLYVWNEDGSVKSNAAFLFAIKEAAIPVTFGIAILTSHWTPKPIIRIVLYTPEMFNIEYIEEKISTNNQTKNYQKLLFSTTLLLSIAFFISAILNYSLAMHFLAGTEESRVAYNEAIGKLTGWGFVVIGLPCLVVSLSSMWRLVKRLSHLTGLKTEEMFVPR